MPAKPDHRQFAAKFWKLCSGLLAEKKLRLNPIRVVEGGLEGVLSALDLSKAGKVSREKLVVKL